MCYYGGLWRGQWRWGASKRIWVLVSSVDSSSNHALLPHWLRVRGGAYGACPVVWSTQSWAILCRKMGDRSSRRLTLWPVLQNLSASGFSGCSLVAQGLPLSPWREAREGFWGPSLQEPDFLSQLGSAILWGGQEGATFCLWTVTTPCWHPSFLRPPWALPPWQGEGIWPRVLGQEWARLFSPSLLGWFTRSEGIPRKEFLESWGRHNLGWSLRGKPC